MSTKTAILCDLVPLCNENDSRLQPFLEERSCKKIGSSGSLVFFEKNQGTLQKFGFCTQKASFGAKKKPRVDLTVSVCTVKKILFIYQKVVQSQHFRARAR